MKAEQMIQDAKRLEQQVAKAVLASLAALFPYNPPFSFSWDDWDAQSSYWGRLPRYWG